MYHARISIFKKIDEAKEGEKKKEKNAKTKHGRGGQTEEMT